MITNEDSQSLAVEGEPVFEGFFLQTVLSGMDAQVEQTVRDKIGTDWQIKHIGDALTQFEVKQPKMTTGDGSNLSIRTIWNITYRLRISPGIVDAEPLFGIPLPEKPIPRSNAFSPVAFSVNQDLPESDDAHWSLNELHVFEAWDAF